MFLRNYKKNSTCTLFVLSNNLRQVYFCDKTELFVWPDALTHSKMILYVDKQQQVVTMGIADAVGNREINKRLKCAKVLMRGSENQRQGY